MRMHATRLSTETVDRIRSMFQVIGNPEQTRRLHKRRGEEVPEDLETFIRGELKALITGPDDLEAQLYHTRPLGLVAVSGNITAARVLLELGADPNAPVHCDRGGTAISQALRLRDIEMLILFAEHGGELPSATMKLIVKERWLDELETLHLAGISLDDPMDRGDTMLLHAIAARAIPVVHALLEQGADPDVRNTDLKTPLHVAVEALQPETVRLLVRYNADLTARSADGLTPKALVAQLRANVAQHQRLEVFVELDAALRTEELKRVAEKAQAERRSTETQDSLDLPADGTSPSPAAGLEDDLSDEMDTALGL